jgi:hypothetical protein
MSFDTINTLEIPQEATELTLNELKLICGGWDDGCEKRERKLKLIKVIKVFKVKERKEHKEHCEDDGGDDDN